ncbi:MAG: hypothetical protein NTX50_17660 [Candidatus Sumerlaeota bacterium]|nr:hypothetical protein [Candidatus Sumerlaeota bacterium]
MTKAKALSAIVLFVLAVPAARANDFMFSATTAPVVGVLFLLWLMIGLPLFLENKRVFRYFGIPGICAAILCVFLLSGHFEFIFMIWMIYIAFLTVYYLFPRPSVSPSARKLNLIFHGSFLLLVIIGGTAAKMLYYANLGGFAEWMARSREYLPFVAVFMGIITMFVSLFVARIAHSDRSKRLAEMQTESFPAQRLDIQADADERAAKR